MHLAQRSITNASPVIAKQTLRHLTKPTTTTTTRLFKPVAVSTRYQRWYSVLTETPAAKIYDYKGIKEIASHPEKYPDAVLVDVREPVEFNDGHIPGAINLPFKSSPGALDLNAEEFQESFGFDKPDAEKELVFYCLGGVRSSAAEELAHTFGYKKRGNYLGSWEDWLSHENKNKAA
ncbi:uncharacterized protein LODBEIA_P17380 [Lodderomyces beijingensis]|uniref:Rhodanese domain-containing protein n=1 Tax=Lodderomyces beijingensis TaxID=1775926 RepID=A0ABP0ZH70_9ASCO